MTFKSNFFLEKSKSKNIFIEIVKDLLKYHKKDIITLAKKWSIPFHYKEQAVNVIAYKIFREHFFKIGNVRPGWWYKNQRKIAHLGDSSSSTSMYNDEEKYPIEEKEDFFAPSKFINDLTKYLQSVIIIPDFLDLLKSTSAIIAGGSVLSSYGTEEHSINDLDIYVKIKDARKIGDFLLINDFKIISSNIAPAYDQSFFRKNNIISRYRFDNSVRNIDLMIIPDTIEPSDVASNFDLSFCEIWFDGENIHTKNETTKEYIRNREGVLNPEYHEALFKCFNNFIIKRIKKYTDKYKYEIKLNWNNVVERCPKKSVNNDEEWVVKFIYKFFCSLPDITNLYYAQMLFPLQEFTMVKLNELINTISEKINTSDLLLKLIKTSNIYYYNKIYFNIVLNITGKTEEEILNVDYLYRREARVRRVVVPGRIPSRLTARQRPRHALDFRMIYYDYKEDINKEKEKIKKLERDLIKAIEDNNIESIKNILGNNKVNMNTSDKDGETALMMAVRIRHEEVVQFLLDAGANVNAVNIYGWTALMHSARVGHADIVNLLLDTGTDVNTRDKYGWTALMMAAIRGHSEVVKILLENGAVVNAVNKIGETALMFAAEEGRADVVNLLLDSGADVNTFGNRGWTALMRTARGGYTEVVNLLLDSGADVNAVNNRGDTALIMAAEEGNVDVVKILYQRCNCS